MGKLVSGINGPFIGKVANTIGSSWRGIPYIKSRGLRTKPATEGEKLNRFIFGKTQKWLYPLTNFLRVGFKDYTHTNQGVNAAKSYLYKHALIKDGYDTVIDPTLMKVSYGTLPLPNKIQSELTEENKLVFTWDAKTKKRVNEFDQVILLAYDIEKGIAEMLLNGQFRNIGRAVLDVATLKNFVVYAAFISADRNSQSDSVYLGEFTCVQTKKTTEEKLSNSKTKGKIKQTAKAVESESTQQPDNQQPATIIQAPVIMEQAAATMEHVPENQLSLFDFPTTPAETQAEIVESKNQKFTYINPNTDAKEEAPGISDINEKDETEIIRRERLTIYKKKDLDDGKQKRQFG